MSAPSRFFGLLGLTAFVVAVTIAAEQQSPGITIITAFVIAKIATGLLAAAMWPITAAFLVWVGFKAGECVGRRDAIREVASGVARDQQRQKVLDLRSAGRAGEN